MDAGVVAFFELLVFVVAGGEAVVGVADGWADPVVLESCFEPFFECHLWLHFLAAVCPFSVMSSQPSMQSHSFAGFGSGV